MAHCRRAVAALVALWLWALAGTSGAEPVVQVAPEEQRLVAGLRALTQAEFEQAFERLEALVAAKPDFRLAQAVYGDLLMARAGRLAQGPRLDAELLAEARVRLDYADFALHRNHLPASLVQLNPHQRHAIVVDLQHSRLYLYENRDGMPHLVADYYASHGKNGAAKEVEGDKKTPLGVYRVTSFIEDGELPPLYGSGALPIDYPNPWDRLQGRTGYGIWLHGSPTDTYSRPPQASDGCVALTNPDFAALSRQVDAGSTPVVITPRVEWLRPQAWRERQRQLQAVVDQWREDWASRDHQRYLAHYSPAFQARGLDLPRWSDYKRRVNGAKRFIDVRLRDLSLFLYPGEEPMFTAQFVQDYRSDNFNRVSRKRLFWRWEQGRWRIVHEVSG